MLSFDDEVDVIVLHAELENAKARVRGRRQRAPHGGKHAIGSETPDRVHGAKCDVDRMRAGVRRADWANIPF